MYSFSRLVRTTASESYVIWPQGKIVSETVRVGSVDLHWAGQIIHGTLVLEQVLDELGIESLIEAIDERLVGQNREDFILTAYQGREIGFYSDNLSPEEIAQRSATQKDVSALQATFAKILGRHQSLRGKLAEHAVAEYFETLDYKAERAGPALDALKIDVVAQSDSEIVYAQCKAGTIAASEMRKIIASVAGLPMHEGKRTVVAIVAREFPKNSETIRRQMEAEFSMPIMCIQLYQVAAALPEYRHSLSV